MNILMGLITADTGTVTILGHKLDSHDFPMELKRRMNMCSGNANLPWSLTVREILRFYSMIYNIPSKKAEENIGGLIHETGLEKYADKRFDELSTGNKQKLSLAKALLNEPSILLLDEPTLGLDPDISLKIRAYIKKIHSERNVTVLLTTHYMKEAEELCGRIAFIRDGRITALGTAEELKKQTESSDMEGMFIELANQQD
jgi:ABC-2 type transport system ATP-binding protein